MTDQPDANSSKPLNAAEFRHDSLQFIVDLKWWRSQISPALVFARFCLLPGLGLGALNIGVVCGYALLGHELRGVHTGVGSENVTEVDLFRLLFILLALMGGLIVVLVLSFWFLWIWLMRLTAFCHAWLTVPHDELNETAFQNSIKSIGARNHFYMGTWLFASLYLLLPVFPLALILAAFIVTGPEFSKFGVLPPMPHSQSIVLGLGLAASVLSALTLAYTFAVIVISSVSELSPAKTAYHALLQCLRHFVLIVAVSCLVLFGNVLVSAPQMLLFFAVLPEDITKNVWLSSFEQVWFALWSLVLWPLSMTPFCHLVATRVDRLAKDN